MECLLPYLLHRKAGERVNHSQVVVLCDGDGMVEEEGKQTSQTEG